MNNIRSTLATVWRIAAPYFRSEDKWAGRGLLAAVIAIELAVVFLTFCSTAGTTSFTMRFRSTTGPSFTYQIGYFCVLATFWIGLKVYQLYLNQWLQIRWRRWMTDPLSRRLAARRQSLPDAAAGRRRRQPGPAHRRRRQAVRRADADIGIGLLSCGRHARIVCRHPVGPVRGGPAALFGKEFAIPGYLVWGALIYAHVRNRC